MAVATIIALFCCISSSIGQIDQTIVAETFGEAVVEAVIGRIRQSAIFPDDHTLLRRIAYVESRDGNDQRTYRNGYNGGVWQVDEIRFQDTKSIAALENERNEILFFFDINWSTVTWADLRRPLYSGLAARLLLANILQAIPLASEIALQASYWKQHYNQNGTVQQFIDDVMMLESTKGNLLYHDTVSMYRPYSRYSRRFIVGFLKYLIAVCQAAIDLIFVLDASGSVGASNFQLMRDFTTNVIRNLNIGPDATRVGLVLYSSSASVQFNLNTHMTNTSLLQAIAAVPFTSGGTNTAAAITTCIQQFDTSFGARPQSSGISRVAIVVTDGLSSSRAATIAAAEMAHSEGILSYAVGVGNNVNMEELAAIASDPDSQYLRSLSGFNPSELRSLQETLNDQACTGE